MKQFAGKAVLVTGGTKGVGRAIAVEFAQRGAHVIVNWFHDRSAAMETVARIVAAGGTGEELRASVAKPDDVVAMFRSVNDRHGRLDVLVNSAARGTFVPSAALTERDWQRSFEVNVHGPRRCARAALPLLSRVHGTVVNVSSIGARFTIDNYSVVGVAKAAVEALTRYLAVEFAAYGVRVNAASASMLETATAAMFPDSDRLCSAIAAATPLGRLGSVEDLARLVVFLASEESGWITGQNILVDGGLSLGHAMLRASPGASTSPEERLAEPGGRSDNTVAIVGTGLMVPGADSPDAFWELLRRGEPAFSEPPADRFDIDRFWSADAADEDRTYSRLAGYVMSSTGGDLSVGWLRQAISQAYSGVRRQPGSRVACFVGACADGNLHFEHAMVAEYAARRLNACWPRDAKPGVERLREVLRDHYRVDGAPADHLPDGVVRAAVQGLLPDGSSYAVVDTACSSSLYAVDMGVKNLLDGHCDLALCGGVFMFTPRFSVTFAKLGGLSRQGDVRPFDRTADGTLFSDGAAVLALKRLTDARRDGDQVLGVLAGFGAASDGRGKSIYAPAENGQRLAIQRAHAAGGVSRDDVVWIVGHGTGTAAGDATELRVLRQHASAGVLCTSNKSLVGHTGWPAGALSLIHAILGLRHGMIPAQHRYAEPVEPTAPVRIPVQDTPLAIGRRGAVGVSGFGFGGTNAHQIITTDSVAPRPSQPPPNDGRWAVLAWSAHLPGNPSTRTVATRITRGLPPSAVPTFGPRYPAPTAHLLRLPAGTVAAMDRTHLMAIAVAERFAAEHGPLWKGREEATGVIAAHVGPTTAYGDAALRCYADDLSTVRMPDRQAEFDATIARWRRQLESQRTQVSKDTQPGLMGNIIPARIAAHLDLNGLALLVDAGPVSTRTAITTACQYLRTGQLDLALVLALHGNSTPELATLLNVENELAEGAFLIAFAREVDARAAGWPVLCTLTNDELCTLLEQEPGHRAGNPWYGAANEAIDFLAAVERRAAGSLPAVSENDQVPAIAIRYAAAWTEVPAQPAVSAWPGSEDMLVLTDTAEFHVVPDRVHASGAVVVTADEAPNVLANRGFRHLRVFGTMPDRQHWPAPPGPGLLALQEALFLAARGCRDQLESLGVVLNDPLPHGIPHPHTGLFTGLLNTLAWDLGRCRFACTITDRPATDWWALLEAELAAYDGSPVTLHRGRTRLRRRLYASPPPASTELPALDDGAVVVATGGARGITAACVEALAVRSAIQLWLLGSSPLGGVPPDLLEAPDRDLQGLRADYIARERRTSGSPSVAELNDRFNRMLRARETTLTLNRLRGRCGDTTVRYLTCDLTDAAAVARAAATIGPVDLLVHAAGVHRGGDIARITLPAMRAVRDVKLAGYHNLKLAFRDPPPRRWCNFGSVAGLVGLPGETDYAPANDVLGAAAEYESIVRGTEEFTIAWTFWAGVGMGAATEVQRANARSGRMSALAPQVGVSHFLAELPRRVAVEPHVSFLSTVETTSFTRQSPALFAAQEPPRAGLFLGSAYTRLNRGARWTLHLDPRVATYLRDHLVAGQATVPGAVLAAIAVEASLFLAPETVPRALRCLRFRSFVRPPGQGQAPHQVVARLLETDGPDTSVSVQITSDVLGGDGRVLRTDREHFRATVVLGPPGTGPSTPRRARPGPGEPTEDPYYRADSAVRLSGVFRAAHDWRVGPHGATARWRPDLRPRPDARDLLDRTDIPVTLLDVLARTRALYATDGRTYVPRAIDVIDLHPYATNDAALAHRHPTGLDVLYDPSDQTAAAVAADGTVLLHLAGLDLVGLSPLAADLHTPGD